MRKEKFGLLFYDYRGPRLYFLPSEDLLEDWFFDGKYTANELVNSICAERNLPRERAFCQVSRILALLTSKGLIHEQSIC